jgi:hypothetical protein
MSDFAATDLNSKATGLGFNKTCQQLCCQFSQTLIINKKNLELNK